MTRRHALIIHWVGAIVMFAAGLLGAGPSAAQQPGGAADVPGADNVLREEFTSGIWAGRAFVTARGAFSHCTIGSDFDNDVRIIFILSVDALTVRLVHPQWQLQRGARYPVQMAVDGGAPITVNGEVFATDRSIDLHLGASEVNFRVLRFGSVMTVTAQQQSFAFRLEGTSAGLERLRQCVQQHRVLVANPDPAPGQPVPGQATPGAPAPGQPTTQNPFAPPALRPPSRVARPGVSDSAEQAAQFLSGLFGNPGLRGFRVVNSSADLREGGAALNWVGPNAAAGMMMLQDAENDQAMGELIDVIGQRLRSACRGGRFGYARRVDRLEPDWPITRVEASCTDSGRGSLVANFTFIRWSTYDVMQIAHFGASAGPGRAAEQLMIDGIRAALIRPGTAPRN